MNKILNYIAFVGLFWVSAFNYCMNSATSIPFIKIQTKDGEVFEIERSVAEQSMTLKNMINDIGEQAEQLIPLPEISKAQFELIVRAMRMLAKHQEKIQEINVLFFILDRIIAPPHNKLLNNEQLIEFVAGLNYLDVVHLLYSALEHLCYRKLKVEEWRKLSLLGDKLKDFWQLHPFRKELEGIAKRKLGRFNAEGVFESSDSRQIISWIQSKGVQIWDKNNLHKEPIILDHPYVEKVIESRNGKYLISIDICDMKIWDLKNLQAKPITFTHDTLHNDEHHFKKYFFETADSKRLVFWGDSSIIIANLEHPGEKRIFKLKLPRIRKVKESLDGNYLLASGDNSTKIWDLRYPELPLVHEFPEMSRIIETPDQKNFIGLGHGEIRIYRSDNLDKKPIVLKHKSVSRVFSHVFVTADNKFIISWEFLGNEIRIWDLQDLTADPIILEHEKVEKVKEGTDGKFLYSRSSGMIKIWDSATFTLIAAHPHEGSNEVRESRDKTMLISYSMKDNSIKIWHRNNLSANPIAKNCKRPSDVIESVNEKWLIGIAYPSIYIWDKHNLVAPSTVLSAPYMNCVAEGRDGKYLLSTAYNYKGKGSPGATTIWDLSLFNNMNAEHILLFLAVYFVHEDMEEFGLSLAEQKMLKSAFDDLSFLIQKGLEERAPKFVAAIKKFADPFSPVLCSRRPCIGDDRNLHDRRSCNTWFNCCIKAAKQMRK